MEQLSISEAIKVFNEVRKEDDIYFQGPFWIIADSLEDIRRNKFHLEGLKIPCFYDGSYAGQNSFNRNDQIHKRYWRDKLSQREEFKDKAYNYYPRGRVGIYEANGIAYIFINSQFNIPFVIDAIVKEYHLENLEIEIELNDVNQGSHYDFQLK